MVNKCTYPTKLSATDTLCAILQVQAISIDPFVFAAFSLCIDMALSHSCSHTIQHFV